MNAQNPPPPESSAPQPLPRAPRAPQVGRDGLSTLPDTPHAWSEFRKQFEDLTTSAAALAVRVHEQAAVIAELRKDLARHSATMERIAQAAETAAQAARDAADRAIEVITARETERHQLAELIAKVAGLDARCEQRHQENGGLRVAGEKR